MKKSTMVKKFNKAELIIKAEELGYGDEVENMTKVQLVDIIFEAEEAEKEALKTVVEIDDEEVEEAAEKMLAMLGEEVEEEVSDEEAFEELIENNEKAKEELLGDNEEVKEMKIDLDKAFGVILEKKALEIKVEELEAKIKELEEELGKRKNYEGGKKKAKEELASKEYNKEELIEMRWQNLKLLGSELGVDTFGKKKNYIVNGVLEAQKAKKDVIK